MKRGLRYSFIFSTFLVAGVVLINLWPLPTFTVMTSAAIVRLAFDYRKRRRNGPAGPSNATA